MKGFLYSLLRIVFAPYFKWRAARAKRAAEEAARQELAANRARFRKACEFAQRHPAPVAIRSRVGELPVVQSGLYLEEIAAAYDLKTWVLLPMRAPNPDDERQCVIHVGQIVATGDIDASQFAGMCLPRRWVNQYAILQVAK